MGDKIIVASNHRDSHGFVMTEQALSGMVEQINGELKIPMLMNHRRELPPLGRHGNAQLLKDGSTVYVTAEIEEYADREEVVLDDKNLVKESFRKPAPLISRFDQNIEGLTISLDPANFLSFEHFEEINGQIFRQDKTVKLDMHGRKSAIPPPEIIIQIGSTIIIWKILEIASKKIIEKITEDLYGEGKKQLKTFKDYVSRTLRLFRKNSIPKDRPVNIIFEIHTRPFIELIAKTDNFDQVEKGLRGKSLFRVRNSVSTFQGHFAIDRIQFKLNKKGDWEFNYLITKSGEAIGIKETFKERDKQYQRYKLQSLPSSRGNRKK
jgi:hypothetical protein